jgi:membrane protein required for colicin V production
MESFEAIDYVFLLVLVLSTLFGFARGFIRELFTILNMLIAVMATYFLYPHSYKFFGNYVTDENVIKICSIFLVFITAWIVIIIINSFLIDLLGKSKGSFFDRLLGTAFGLFRGSLMIISFYISLVIFFDAKADDKNLPDWMRIAKTHNFVRMASESALDYMPLAIQKSYDEGSHGMFDNAIAALTRNGPITDDERRIKGFGFDMDNIETLKKILSNLPPGYNRDLDFKGLAELPEGEYIDYVQNLLVDYDSAISEGRIEDTLSRRKIESLKRSLDEMKSEYNPTQDGVY